MEDFTLKPDILQTAKGSVLGDIDQLQTAIYGREVRASIAEALYLLYTGNIVLPASDGTQKSLAELVDTSGIAQRLAALEMAVGMYAYPYPDLDGDDVISATDASHVQEFAAAVGTGTYTNDVSGWAGFAKDSGLSGMYPDVNGDGFADATDAALMLDFAAKTGTGSYSNDKAGWEAYMNGLFRKIGNASQSAGVMTTHLTGITGTTGIMEEITETEAANRRW